MQPQMQNAECRMQKRRAGYSATRIDCVIGCR
jgi:hypothetical protein